MNRRGFLRAVARGGAVVLAVAAGVAVPAARSLWVAAGEKVRAPADLLARLRRNTRPLDPAELHEPHDLAG